MFAHRQAGDLWIGTDNGLNKLIYSNQFGYQFRHYHLGNQPGSGFKILSIYSDSTGILWIGTSGDGLYLFNPSKGQYFNFRFDINNPKYLRSNYISYNSIFEDKNGSFWIGTDRAISIFNKQKIKFRLYPYDPGAQRSLNIAFVWSICEDWYKNLWFSGPPDKIVIRDEIGKIKPLKLSFHHYTFHGSSGPPSNYVDKSGTIWFSSKANLEKFNPATGKLDYFCTFFDKSNSSVGLTIDAIFEDSDSLLWVGTNRYLRVFNKNRTIASEYIHDDNDPYSLNSYIEMRFIYEDKRGAIWVGFNNKGVDKFDKKTRKFIHYQHNPLDSNSLSNNLVMSIFDDSNGNIWVATYGGGLDKLNIETDKFTHYTVKDGLLDNFLNYMHNDNSGNLWLSTNKGLSRFNLNSRTVKNYNIGDGLQENEFAGMIFKTSKGEMLFVGVHGLVSFYPDSLIENKHIPPVVITSFKILDKEAEFDSSITKTTDITLSHEENVFSFTFAALDYTNPKKNEYAYKLDGIDKDWRYSGNIRTASYTNIDPGEYVFRVKGSNNDGVWNVEGTSVKITITPPWWQTWWFRFCGALVIAGAIGFAFTRRLLSLKKDKKTQEEFTRQLISAHEDERKRIAGELHDSLGQNLLIIKNKAVLGLKKNEDKLLFNEISEISSSTLQEVREISYNLHPYQLERLGLTKALESITERVLKSTDIKFQDELDIIDNMFSPEAEINIYRIIQECINNIINHSSATEARLIIKKECDKVLINISDNGRGFDVNAVLSDKSKRGIGLMDIMERAKLFNGKVEIESAPGKGTTCKIIIPFNH